MRLPEVETPTLKCNTCDFAQNNRIDAFDCEKLAECRQFSGEIAVAKALRDKSPSPENQAAFQVEIDRKEQEWADLRKEGILEIKNA